MDEKIHKLQEAGLFNSGLCVVEGVLVERYNECLRLIGIEPTNLPTFQIDGMGWSPEVAEEKGNPFYLAPDGSVAIIITPLQEQSPVYFPFYSFDKRMMKMVFRNAKNYIRDITARAGLIVDINQQMVDYSLTPFNLLLIDRFTLKFSLTRDYHERSKKQKELVDTFVNGGWASPDVRKSLIESVKDNDDLRMVNLDIPDMNFLDLDAFYVKAFNGVFVFRGVNSMNPLLVFSDKEKQKSGGIPSFGSKHFHLNDKKLKDYFIENNVIGVYESELASDKGKLRLHRLQDLMLIDGIINEAGVNANKIDLKFLENPVGRKRVADRLFKKGLLSEAYNSFAELSLELEQGNMITEQLSKPIVGYNLLLRPNPELPENIRNVIWMMLVRKNPFDFMRLYIHDREQFYREFVGWSEWRQDWVIQYLQKHFDPSRLV